MEKEEFDAMRDKILEFLKEHPKLDIFYTDDMERDWPLELEPDFGEFEYNRIFRWSNSIIVGIEYKAGGITSLNNITVELAELFGTTFVPAARLKGGAPLRNSLPVPCF